MEQLKALLEKKKQEAAEEFNGQKFVRAKDIEEARLKRLRDEEEEDRARKVKMSCDLGIPVLCRKMHGWAPGHPQSCHNLHELAPWHPQLMQQFMRECCGLHIQAGLVDST